MDKPTGCQPAASARGLARHDAYHAFLIGRSLPTYGCKRWPAIMQMMHAELWAASL